MRKDIFAQSKLLSLFILKRDRVSITLWLSGIVFFTLVVPISFRNLYPTQEARDVMAETMRNPAMTAMVGPGSLEQYTIGAMTAHQMLLLTAVVVGLMNILLVVRHTRGDEEEGRMELVRALPVGRQASLQAMIMVFSFVNLLLALLTGLGLVALGIESMDVVASMLYGASLGATGLFFAGAAGVFAQLLESPRGAVGFSITVLIGSYLVRAFGDVSHEAFTWLSPLGWVTKTEVYSNNLWWPMLLLVGSAMVLFIFSHYLHAMRDLEAGFISFKPGKSHASTFLQHPIGLVLRLQRTGTIAWAIGMLLMGLSYGAVLGDLEGFFEGNERLKQMLSPEEGHSLTEQFIPMLMVVMALLSTIAPLLSMLKLFGEEKKNRTEHLLGRAVLRTRLMASYLVISLVNGFIMLSLAAIGLWAAGTVVMEETFEFGTIYGAALLYYPAMLVMIGISVLLIGIKPRLNTFIWIYVLYSFIVLYLGKLFQLPAWVGRLSPYGHIPQLPVEEIKYPPLIMLIGIASILLIIGFTGYKKRDIEG